MESKGDPPPMATPNPEPRTPNPEPIIFHNIF